MAADRALLDYAISREVGDPLLRIYRWSSPALSMGRHQRIDGRITHACQRWGVELVRRPTGGTGVLHHGDVTYSVVAPSASRGVMENYRWVACGLIAAFESLGLEASVAEHERPTLNCRACFAASTGADLAVAGAKICGSAQLRRQGWFLQHGSIPIADHRELSRRLLNFTEADSSTCLDRLRPGTTALHLGEALVQGFSQSWGDYQEYTFDSESWTLSSLMLA